ncbi:M4 family metallopeptidase [Archangium lipolyticum]|uniref:M4 family metallopeptidase n=1 Tax=Archangium lipolyticum TaxID=2970465 RepID=UPI00214A417B|nr:M4 family metallopeptidase [Archangium lipolyticum]
MLAACLSFALTACGTEQSDPAGEAKADAVDLGSTQDIAAALAAFPATEVLGTHENGVPYMVRGHFGSTALSLQGLAARDAHAHVSQALAGIAPMFRLKASDLVVRQLSRDERGHTHIRYAQTKNGLPVVGHELVVHVDAEGRIYSANGSARDGEQLPSQARISSEAARVVALESTPGGGFTEETPRLVYVRSSADGRLKLTFETVVTGSHAGMPVRDHVFVDALDGSVVERTSDIHDALNRAIYSATPPPTHLVRSEGQAPTGDAVVDNAYDNLGLFYNCFQQNFSRDSFNGAGAQLRATVHYSSNAFWDGAQMTCGDGDGVTSGPLCNDLDIVVHEFTHAVTDSDSDLIYSGESGALNEGMSDIFAAYCESWTRSWSTDLDVWKIGEDIWTPATAGDALRYMYDPMLDGSSRDYYPDRYTGTSDNGGVHWNSGIANLAFKLLATGGTHPRGKSTVGVGGIGVQKAGAIFYRAGRDLMTASTTFAQAKTYTEQAAVMLHGSGSAEQASVTQAWLAVGVGAAVPPPVATALTNGVAKTGLSGASGSQTYYYLDVPAGVASTFALSGGTGDADLYVKAGSAPTTSSYDCRPYLSGSNETCNIPAKTTATRVYVMLRGFNAYAGASLKGTY